jgi:hypothetical protein
MDRTLVNLVRKYKTKVKFLALCARESEMGGGGDKTPAWASKNAGTSEKAMF